MEETLVWYMNMIFGLNNIVQILQDFNFSHQKIVSTSIISLMSIIKCLLLCG